MEYKSIKITERLYDELTDIKDTTNIPLSRLLEIAVSNFKQSKEYAHLMLFAQTNEKIEK